MRILHLCQYYEPFKGGMEKVVMELASGCVAAGFEVTVLSSNFDWQKQSEDIEGVHVVRVPRFGSLFSQPINPSYLWEARRWLEWADVVQVHTPNFVAELTPLIQKSEKPLIVTYHRDGQWPGPLQKIYQPLTEKLLDQAVDIVVATPKHLEHSELLKAYQDKVKVIPFGIRAKHRKQSPRSLAFQEKIQSELGPYFLFVGRLLPYKGVDTLLRSLRAVKEKLVVLGQGPCWEEWYLLAQDLGLGDRVRLIGRVDEDDEFAAYLHGCQALVLPSLNEAESFGVVLLEAFSCGKPVITTELRSGVPWVNVKNSTGLEVKPGDHHGMGQALREISASPEKAQQMGHNALKRFEETFTQDKMVKGYLDLYQKARHTGQKAA